MTSMSEIFTPDLGFQFSPGLDAGTESSVLQSLISSLPPGADVRSENVSGSTRFGVWLRPAGEPGDDLARGRGLDALSLLRAGESFAAHVSAGFLQRSAQIAWLQAPQRIDDEGHPRPDGPLHLTGFAVELQAPDRVVTVLTGRDPRPRPDVQFKLVTTETLSAADGAVRCSSHLLLGAWNERVEAPLNGLGGVLRHSLPATAAWFSPQSAVVVGTVDGEEAKLTAASAGRSVARLLPREILIAGGRKVVLDYQGLEVGPEGVRGGGSWRAADRHATVAVVRPEVITTEFPDPTCTTQLRLRTTDLRPPFREVRWVAAGMVANPRARSTPVVFEVNGARPRQTLSRRVAVQVTDADGLTAAVQDTVLIQVAWSDAEAARFGTEPIRLPAA
jgi:hypothetical protein